MLWGTPPWWEDVSSGIAASGLCPVLLLLLLRCEFIDNSLIFLDLILRSFNRSGLVCFQTTTMSLAHAMRAW